MKIFVDLIISSIGLGFFYYGKKSLSFIFMIAGAILMVYSYFIASALMSLVLGIIIVLIPFILSKFID